MAKQLIYVDDGNIGATENANIVYDSTASTLTTTNAISATGLTLSDTLTGGASTDIALNTNKFTVDATNGNTVIAGTCDVTGALASGAHTLTGNSAISGDLTVSGLTYALGVFQQGYTSYVQGGAVVLPLHSLFTAVGTTGASQLDASLAAGGPGQMKIIIFTAKNTYNCVLTPANFSNGTTITFDTAGEVAVLVSTGTYWHVVYTDATVA